MTQTKVQSLFQCGTIRLHELSVYNWGSFNSLHSARIDPEGTLITGDNGAGKSTLVDALMALLLPAGKATFNVAAAQGDRSDRSLISYIRGSYGSAHDGGRTKVLSKRDGAVVSGVRALYRADDGSEMTLAALFWIPHAGNALSDLKRIYLVARRDLPLKELLDAFGDGDPRTLKQHLRQDPAIQCSDDRFSEYQESYRRLLHMDNPNAPALLARALGLKKIDDLTGLIRNLVLEPSSVRDDARQAVNEFADLVGIHDQLLDARRQQGALAELPQVDDVLRKAGEELERLDTELGNLSIWFAQQCAGLWQKRLQTLKDDLQQAEHQLNELEREITDAASRVEQRHADYLQAGGERIELLRKDLKSAEDKLSEVNRHAADYQQTAARLDLDTELSEPVFHANQQRADAARRRIEEEKVGAQDHFAAQVAQLSNTQEQRRQLAEEILAIEARPDSNIDARFQRLRDEMADALELDRSRLMFIGELVDVREEERPWQGAIERALGGLRTTLAVPEGDFPLVTRWLNQRHTGLHVRVQVVRAHSGQADFLPDGYLRKLIWREHPYREWAKHHLARFDLHCVESTEVLDRTPFSMTRQGLVHLEKGRFEKKDQQRIDDRRAWQLGFSNKTRLALLKQDVGRLEHEATALERAVTQARQALDEVGRREVLWERLARFRWPEIDVPYWQSRVERCRSDLAQLEQAGGDLAKAKAHWEAAKSELQGLQARQSTQKEQLGALKTRLDNANHNRQRALKLAEPGLDDELQTRLQKKTGLLRDDQLEEAAKIEAHHRQRLEAQRVTVRNRRERASRGAVGIMTGFRTRWEVIAADWGVDLASLNEYLNHLAQLEREGLPALVEKFRERLNRHTTQSLARIRSRIDSEREDIFDRIDTINRVLQRTEFRPGSYLRLGIKNEQYDHVRHFNRLLQGVMEQVTSDDHEARFAGLSKVIDILDKASNPASAHTLESLRLLDPRHQLSFYAEEIGSADGEIRDVLTSSSGKSGGEKESFAGTIVAASLAYVLTPDGSDRPVYATVFLDEAFSNTAEAVSRRVLRVFKELHLHVNLITPYKNLNLARESARSLLIVERDAASHESRLCEVTWEEIDRQLEQQARELGVAVEAAR